MPIHAVAREASCLCRRGRCRGAVITALRPVILDDSARWGVEIAAGQAALTRTSAASALPHLALVTPISPPPVGTRSDDPHGTENARRRRERRAERRNGLPLGLRERQGRVARCLRPRHRSHDAGGAVGAAAQEQRRRALECSAVAARPPSHRRPAERFRIPETLSPLPALLRSPLRSRRSRGRETPPRSHPRKRRVTARRYLYRWGVPAVVGGESPGGGSLRARTRMGGFEPPPIPHSFGD